MADKTPLVATVQTEIAITRKVGLPVYPYVYRRSYTCCHAPEFVKVSKSANQKGVLHTVLKPDQVEGDSQKYRWLKYKLGRCRSCAIRLREHHKSIQESKEGERMRPIAAYQGEGMRLDRGLLREAKSGFEAGLKQLDRVSCCGGEDEEEEEERPLTREVIGGDNDSIRVVRFLDGRRKVDSPASSPSTFAHGFNNPWSLRGGGSVRENDSCANCTACVEVCQGRRKDSAFEVHHNADPNFNNDVQASAEGEQPQEFLQDVHIDTLCTPMVFAFGPHSDLDWLRFSYLLCNNQLSFDDIAELTTRLSLDDSNTLLKDIVQQSLSVDHKPYVRNSTLQMSVRQPGVVERDVSPSQEHSQASILGVSDSRHTRCKTSCGAEDQRSNCAKTFYHEPAQTQINPREVKNGEMEERPVKAKDSKDLEQSRHNRNSDDPDVSQSCFSSDSSADSFDLSKPEFDVMAPRKRSTALSRWKPKRNYDVIHELSRAASIPNFQECSIELWMKISQKMSNRMLDRSLMDESNREPQAKLPKIEDTSLRASSVSQRCVNRDSDCHPGHRKQTTAPNIQSEFSDPSRILGAVKTLNKTQSSQSMTRNTNKSHRGSHNSSSLIKPKPSSNTQPTKVAPHGFHPVHRPYKPSPLKHVTRVTSLDVNKGLPPLPPEARRLAHQASKGTLKEVAAVRKLAMLKVINEYVDEMARAY